MTQETITVPPTLDELGMTGDVEAILEAAENDAKGLMTEPSERWKSKSALITRDGQELPERVRVWRTQNGMEAWLPTAMISHHMRKTHANGQRVFSRTPIDTKAIPIDQSCEICSLRGITKRFMIFYDYEGHMGTFHPREWESQIRQQEREERAEEQRLMRELVQAAGGQSVKATVKTMEPETGLACDVCSKPVKSQFGLQAHKRTHN